jgi:glycosyltransferase involved in cell wall biosynthesis
VTGTADEDGEPEAVLPDAVPARLAEIGAADILVGIPTWNSEATVPHVVRAVEAGLRKHFPDGRSVICISDGGSSDGTMEAAATARVGDDAAALLVPPSSPEPARVAFRYGGIPGKGSAFRAIFEVASTLGVAACAVVDSDLRSITPYWLDRLISPVLHHGYGYVAPVYQRHKYDGTITNSLAYPVTTALYGTQIRQPIGGEFGFSGELARAFAAEEEVWGSDVARFGVDIWMTTTAVVRGARTCQAILGAKIHDPKDPGADLGPMFRQVVGSLFALAGRYRDRWWEVEGAATPPTFGFRSAFSAEPVECSVPRLTWKFVEGYGRHLATWREVLSDQAMRGVEEAVSGASESGRGLVLDTEVWMRIVYDFLVAYNAGVQDTGILLDSLIPLYFARTATFVEATRDDDPDAAEAKVQEAAELAVELKPYLRRRWEEAAVPERLLRDQPVTPGNEGSERLQDALTRDGS